MHYHIDYTTRQLFEPVVIHQEKAGRRSEQVDYLWGKPLVVQVWHFGPVERCLEKAIGAGRQGKSLMV